MYTILTLIISCIAIINRAYAALATGFVAYPVCQSVCVCASVCRCIVAKQLIVSGCHLGVVGRLGP